jgi:multiple sugar transport system substrate-binding protein
VLSNADWLGVTDAYWSGQKIHQVMAVAAQAVNVDFGWSPFTNFVFTTYADLLVKVRAGSMTFGDAMTQLQTTVVGYAKDQGFTVTTP